MAAAKAPHNPLLVLSYGTIIGLWVGCQYVLIPYVVNLMLLVTAILYAGCHWSLALREEQAVARGETPDGGEKSDGGDDDDHVPSEVLRKEDAMLFPIIGSCSLFGLYLAFKFFDKETVNLVISFYFCAMGSFAITGVLGPVLEGAGPAALRKRIGWHTSVNHPLPESVGGKSPWKIGIDCSHADLLAFAGGVAFCVQYFYTKKWFLNNVLGICFCLKGIEQFSLGSYKIGAILLVGLFFYDIVSISCRSLLVSRSRRISPGKPRRTIGKNARCRKFWVFGTEVMVTVAKSLDGPIKILFPRTLEPDPETGKLEMSLLGLGDIVIPGFFLGLLLRFDAHIAGVPYFPTDVNVGFPKPYFHSTLAGYVVGLATTLYVMIVFEAAQPALLYLVPACLGSSLMCAVSRGELTELFQYSEEDDEEEEKKEGDEKEAKEKKDD